MPTLEKCIILINVNLITECECNSINVTRLMSKNAKGRNFIAKSLGHAASKGFKNELKCFSRFQWMTKRPVSTRGPLVSQIKRAQRALGIQRVFIGSTNYCVMILSGRYGLFQKPDSTAQN